MKHFKVRIELPNGQNFYAIEAWLQAENIIDAGSMVMTYFGALGIGPDNVTKLIEINSPN